MEQSSPNQPQTSTRRSMNRMKVSPDTLAYVEDNGRQLNIEFEIPGAPGDSIDLKMLEDSVYLAAPARNIEYVAAISFCCPVKPEQAQASYENGLLRIQVPFKDPMEGAVNVPIRGITGQAIGQGQQRQLEPGEEQQRAA